MITLNALLSALAGQKIITPDVPISSVVIDSRQASENSLFIALPGEKVNGHDYIAAAFENGAKFALINQPLQDEFTIVDLRKGFSGTANINLATPLCIRVENTLQSLQSIAAQWRQQHHLRVIAITGSVGKTSTKELAAALLSQKFNVLKNQGNRNNEIGLPLTLLELNENHQCAVLEMGFYVPGEIQTLCNIARPLIGLITNIGTVHAERAGSKETIARGKSELVESLPDDGVAILNLDDPWVRGMKQKTNASILSYGIKESADVTASDIESHGLQGLTCQIHFQGKSRLIHSPLMGEFSVYTILAASAIAFTEGLSWDELEHGLTNTRIDIRMRHFTLPNGAILLDDTYNATPESTIAALQLLRNLKGRRVAILGDMLELGRYEEKGHQSVGAFASNAADILVLVGERSKSIARAAITNGFPKENLHWYLDSSQAAGPVTEIIQKGDFVLVKGSNSMHMNIIINRLEVRQ